MAKISVVINAFNSENSLPEAIASVKNFANEIVVVNQESADDTAEVAKKLGAKVFDHKKVAYVELARNFAISKATGDWILILDPDEMVPNSLTKKLRDIVKNNKADYYRISRKNIIFGKWMKHSRWWPDYNIRFFKKDNVTWNEIIHSVPITSGNGLDLEAKEENSIVHNHYDSIDQYLSRLNRYTTTQAEMKVKENYFFSWRDLITKPLNEFFSRYFFGSGYKDGLHGLSLSLLQAFSELIVYLKVWEMKGFKEENINLNDVTSLIDKQSKDYKYWKADSDFKETGKFISRIKRKFRI